MKELIKLRDLTPEQWDNFLDKCKMDCDNCICDVTSCKHAECKGGWFNNKDMFSDKFLNQTVEIDMPDGLEEKEKEYLSAVIKPFKAKIISITKFGLVRDDEYIFIKLINGEEIRLPRFKENTMYKEMEAGKHYTLEELGLVQKEYKITLTEFWSSKEKLAIHCDTEEKANKLLRAFNKIGKKWCAGNSYINANYWTCYKEEACYSNDGGCAKKSECELMNYKVYEFEDVIVED